MVIRLNRPMVDDETLVDQLVAERQAGRHSDYFTNIHGQWRQRVADYVGAQGNPEVVEPWDKVADVGERFRNLYSHPGEDSVQKPILESLRERTLQLCPACGEDGTPNTLDHYLPKTSYPEFAVTPSNLFPMCDICQGKKGARTVADEGDRLFLHPYFDHFLAEQVVQLSIGVPYNAPASIELSVSDAVAPEHRAVISRHLETLHISQRYHHFFRTEYIRLLRLVFEIRQHQQDVANHIQMFRWHASTKSVNSWGHVFYDGVARNKELMTFLQLGSLPEV